MAEGPKFLDVHGGKVHVIAPEGPERDVIGFLLGDTRTICGLVVSRHRGGFDQCAEPTSAFDDERLCARCWRATPEEERERLFEHDVPVD